MSHLDWQRRRILIWGKTRPELSSTYKEIVCTGGIFADTKRLVRLYPIPLRFLDDERIFKKYQWIEATVARNLSDPRPESYRIAAEEIETGETIPTGRGNWDDRAEWVMQPENIFPSVEALQAQQQKDRTSLGLVKPAEVTGVKAVPVPQKERENFNSRYEETVRQMDLPLDPETGREVKPLRAPDYRFKIAFRCDDPECDGHEFSVLDWEMDALYFRLRTEYSRSRQKSAEGVIEKLRDQICTPDKDLYFYLGNFAHHPWIFSIVGLWWPKKKNATPQQRLFE